jgi:hypothetical protein
LLILGFQYLAAALVSLPAGPPAHKMREMRPVTAPELQDLVDARRRSIAWRDDGRARGEIGFALLLEAEMLPAGTTDRDAALDRAIAAIEDGLATTPLDARGWARLAYARSLRDGWTAPAISALRLAISTAPFEPALTPFRLALCLDAWPHLPTADRTVVLNQLRYAWRVAPDAVVGLARATGSEPLIRAALRERPEDFAEFDRRSGPVQEPE